MRKFILINSRALVLNTEFADQYSDILDDNLENANIMSFSLDDYGVEILNQLDLGTSMEALRFWYRDRTAKDETDFAFFYKGNRNRLDAKVVYQRSFLIFSLLAKGKTQKRLLSIWWLHNSGVASMKTIDIAYEVRCRDDLAFQYTGNPCALGCLPGYEGGGPITEYRPYWSFRPLKNYQYAVEFESTHGSGHLEISNY